MLRISGLDDARVTQWEAKLEQATVDALQQVMDTIARRFERIRVTTAAALVAADDNPPPQTGQLAIPPPEPVPATIPPPGGPPAAPYISPDDLASIPPLWQQLAEQQILPLVAQVFIDAAGHVRSQLLDHVPSTGVLSVPGLGSPVAEEYLRRARNTFSQVGDHLWATARAHMSEGFEAGESIDEMAARMRRSAGLSARSSVLVARTSAIEASNFGSLSMARVSGLEMDKEWIATPDLRTRPSHLAADGQRVPINDVFHLNTGWTCDFPAAPNLPPSERYRCRCTLGYVMPDRPKELPQSTIDQSLPGGPGGEMPQIEAPDTFEREAAPGGEPGSSFQPARGGDFVSPSYIRPALRDAKTPRELTRIWEAQAQQITGYPFYVSRMPRGISLDTAREYAEGTLQMLAQFPGAKVDRIHWWDDAKSPAYARVNRGGHALEFNMKYASEKGRANFLEARRRDIEDWDTNDTSWGVRNDVTGGQGVVYHEFMHILDLENAQDRVSGGLVPILLHHAGNGTIEDAIKRQVSTYATRNYNELIAEAGTDVMVNGDAASELSKEIFDLLRHEYQRRGFVLGARPPGLGGTFAREAAPEAAAAVPLARQTVAQLRALAKERGITVPAGTRKADLVKMLEQREGLPAPATLPTPVKATARRPRVTAAETAAVRRQTVIDQRRTVADSLAEVDELLANGASARALQARAGALRALAGEGEAGKALAPVFDAMESGDAAAIRAAAISARRGAQIEQIGGRAGEVGRFDAATQEVLGGGTLPAGTPVIVSRPGSIITVRGERITLSKAQVAPASEAELAAAERKALRIAARTRQAEIATVEGNAKLLADVEQLIQRKASKSAIAQALDPVLAEPGQLYAGADPALMASLRTALDSGDAAKLRAAVTRGTRTTKVTPIGKAGAKAKYDQATMDVQGGIELPDGAPVIVVRRGARFEGLTDPLQRAQVRVDAPALKFDAKAAKTYAPRPVERQATIVEAPADKITTITAPDGTTMTFRGSWVKVEEPGQPGKFYGSALDEWRDMYEEVPGKPGSWVKVAPVKAYQYHGPPKLLTTSSRSVEGEKITLVQDGDWVVQQKGGEVQRLFDERFQQLYAEPVGVVKPVKGGGLPTDEDYRRRTSTLEVLRRKDGRETPLGGGSRAHTSLIEYPGAAKRKTVKKNFEDTWVQGGPRDRLKGQQELVDREVFGPRIVEAVGGRGAATIRAADREVLMEYVDGPTWSEIGGWGWEQDAAKVARFEAIRDSDAGRMQGLADYLMGNTDRNDGNWILRGDRDIFAIDHDYAFEEQTGFNVWSGAFTEYLQDPASTALRSKIDLNPRDLAVIRTRLEALRPEFEAAGRKTWIDGALRRLKAVEQRADPAAPIRLAEAVEQAAKSGPVEAAAKAKVVTKAPKVTTEQLAEQEGVSKVELTRIRKLMKDRGIRPPIALHPDEMSAARVARTFADDQAVKEFAEQHLAVYNRIAQEVRISQEWSQVIAPAWRLKAEGKTLAEVRREAGQKLQDAVADAPIVIRRATESRLRSALDEGRFKTQFETGTSSGVLDTEMRANFEQMTWGYPLDLPGAQRPIYGYVSTGGVRPVSAGVHHTVDSYGDIQIVLRDSVRGRTTVSAADSLDHRSDLVPAPISAPDWRAGLGHDQDYASPNWYREHYIEAQIHGGVTWDDVAEVVFARQPEKATIEALTRRGVTWRVLA